MKLVKYCKENYSAIHLNDSTMKVWIIQVPKNKLVLNTELWDHPLQIIKQIPNMINKRISDLSSNQTEFDNVMAK